jgi:hypothetical protein
MLPLIGLLQLALCRDAFMHEEWAKAFADNFAGADDGGAQGHRSSCWGVIMKPPLVA